jgi:iron complex outermembrane receptor protein
MRLRSYSRTAASCLALLGAGRPRGRESPVGGPEDEQVAPLLDPVVVTARRPERRQLTPQSVTVLDRTFVERAQIGDLSELALQVPGMVVSDQNASFGSAAVFIRGVGTAVRGLGVSTGVAVYRDGVYQTSPTSILSTFTDVERVEVVRGPQGALHGRNATGGAVNIISRRPSTVFEAAADIAVGSFDARQARGSINVPLNDRVAVRAAAVAERRESYTRNLTREAAGLEPDLDADLLALKASALAELGDGVSMLLRAAHLRDDSYAAFEARNAAPGGLFPIAAVLFRLPLPRSNGTDLYEVRSDVLEPVGRLEQSELAAEISAELGFASLRWISAVQSEETARFIDGDGTDTPLSFNAMAGNSDSFSHEIQLISPSGGRVGWLAGLYAFGQGGRQNLVTQVFGGLVRTEYDAHLRNRAYAAFGQVDWDLTEALNLSAGVRYSREAKRHRLRINGAPAAASTGEITDDDLSPSLVLQWRPTSTVMAYASVAKGFKAGGFNSTQDQARTRRRRSGTTRPA